jgi:hypothetical protein
MRQEDLKFESILGYIVKPLSPQNERNSSEGKAKAK